MKACLFGALCLIGVGILGASLSAQEPGGRLGPPGEEERRFPREGFGGERRGDFGPGRGFGRSPILMALDVDQDGEISAVELEQAAANLKKLDKNSDGILTTDEMLPPPPPGFGGGRGFGERGREGFGGSDGSTEMVNTLFTGDKDNDGFLADGELPERMRPLLGRADANGDQKLSREEVQTIARRLQGNNTRPDSGDRPRPERPPQ